MKKLRVLISIVFMVFLVTSLAIADNSVTVRIRLDPYTLDPTMIYTSDVNIVGRMLFVSLVDFDEEKAEPAPDLATSWDVSPDGTIWTFHLRKDVKWTNGRPVTAHDVV